jgi:hypothetical protein
MRERIPLERSFLTSTGIRGKTLIFIELLERMKVMVKQIIQLNIGYARVAIAAINCD